MMMQGDQADKPRLMAQAYADGQMEEHKAKSRQGLLSSFIGIAMSAVVVTVQQAPCLAVTLGVGGVFALKEFLAHSAHSFSHNCSFRLNFLLVFFLNKPLAGDYLVTIPPSLAPCGSGCANYPKRILSFENRHF